MIWEIIYKEQNLNQELFKLHLKLTNALGNNW